MVLQSDNCDEMFLNVLIFTFITKCKSNILLDVVQARQG